MRGKVNPMNNESATARTLRNLEKTLFLKSSLPKMEKDQKLPIKPKKEASGVKTNSKMVRTSITHNPLHKIIFTISGRITRIYKFQRHLPKSKCLISTKKKGKFQKV